MAEKLLANSHCLLKLTMEDNFDDLLVSHTDTSPLNTIQRDYQKPGCSKEYDEDSDLSDEIPSYQLPLKTEKEQAVEEKKKQSHAKRKRKAEAEVTSFNGGQNQKNGGIHKKKKETLDKTVPSHSGYNVRANIPPDEQFKETFRRLSKNPSKVLFLP